MSIFEEMKKQSEAVRKELDELISLDRKGIYGKDRLASLSFEDSPTGKEAFESNFDLFEEASKCNLDRIPPQQLKALSDRISNFKGFIDRALKLNLESANPKGERDAVVSELQAQYQSNFNAVSPIISFATRAGTDFKKIEREAKSLFTSTKAYAEQMKQELAKKEFEVGEIMQSMRDAAAESGVSQNAVYYKLAEDDHKGLAAKWLKWTISFGAGLFAYAAICTLILMLSHQNQKFEFTYLEVGMMVGFFLGLYGLHFCSKQYNSHRHLTVTNGDKTKALATFKAFAEATENNDVKDILLQQASHSIFSVTPSSYMKNQEPITSVLPGFTFAKKVKDEFMTSPRGGNA